MSMGTARNSRDSIIVESEPNLYHNSDDWGYFALLFDTPNGKKQRCYPLSNLEQVINNLDRSRDTWLSQADFSAYNRRVVNLLRLHLCFVDLDTYKIPSMACLTLEQQIIVFLMFCDDEGIPRPSIILFSGRGLQAKWLFDKPIPKVVLIRWNALQKELVKRLESLGADDGARDASRVLRLIETINTKSGEMVSIVYMDETNGEVTRYDFEYLAELLPYERKSSHRRDQREPKKSKPKLKVVTENQLKTFRGINNRALAWYRLLDLRKLAELRGWIQNGIPHGFRNHYLLWNINFLLLSGATVPNQMFHEAKSLADFACRGWRSDARLWSQMSTLYRKGQAYIAGVKIEHEGIKYPPLYTPSADLLINRFEVTTDEMRQADLRAIITKDIRREHHTEKERERKHRTGERKQYWDEHVQERKNKSLSRKEQAKNLREEGKTNKEIAQILVVHPRTVRKWVNT